MSDTIARARENWLMDAVNVFRPKFEDMGFKLPDLRVSVGYGPAGARFENNIILGVTLNNIVVEDGAFEVWISPEIKEQYQALATLIHELAHCAAGFAAGHRGDFEIIARMFGLEGPLTATHAGDALKDELELMSIELGEYPGSFVDFSKINSPEPVPAGEDAPPYGTVDGKPIYGTPPLVGGRFPRISTGPRKQTTRMHKLACHVSDCAASGYTIRTSARWIAVGLPRCPMGHEMELCTHKQH